VIPRPTPLFLFELIEAHIKNIRNRLKMFRERLSFTLGIMLIDEVEVAYPRKPHASVTVGRVGAGFQVPNPPYRALVAGWVIVFSRALTGFF
jgi:hypothetical protein